LEIIWFKDKKPLAREIPRREFGSRGGDTIYLKKNDEVYGIASLIHNELHPHVDYLQDV